jgi:hypothetical protein
MVMSLLHPTLPIFIRMSKAGIEPYHGVILSNLEGGSLPLILDELCNLSKKNMPNYPAEI